MPELRPTEPNTFAIDEQESGSYLATIQDDLGNLLPGSVLLSLQLTLYVVRFDGSTAIVNSRNHQDVLNSQNVTVYDSLQTTGNGQTYNLRWAVQPADSTLQEDLPYERHYALFEWSWNGGQGKHEVILVVKNLRMVG